MQKVFVILLIAVALTGCSQLNENEVASNDGNAIPVVQFSGHSE